MRQQVVLALWLVAVGGCVGGASDPAGGHELGIGLAASIEDVHELGIDEAGCGSSFSSESYPVPVTGRPDLVAIALDEAVICVTTLEAARACGMDLSRLGAGAVVLAAAAERSEPEPQPYVRAEGGGAASEPEPQPYSQMSSEPEPQPYAEDEGDEAEEPEPQPY